MSIDRDFLRREAKVVDAAHRASLRPSADLLEQVLASELSPQTRADHVLGGLNRRRFLTIGGATIAVSALLAACGDDNKGGSSTAAGPGATTTTVPPSQSDITI